MNVTGLIRQMTEQSTEDRNYFSTNAHEKGKSSSTLLVWEQGLYGLFPVIIKDSFTNKM